MSGTEEAILRGGDGYRPAGGNSVLCFGQVTEFCISAKNGVTVSGLRTGTSHVEAIYCTFPCLHHLGGL